MKYNLGDTLYICGVNIHQGGRINLNRPPRKATVVPNKGSGSIRFVDGDYFKYYPGYEIFNNLEDCELAYDRMKNDAVLFCSKQMDKFNKVIEILKK